MALVLDWPFGNGCGSLPLGRLVFRSVVLPVAPPSFSSPSGNVTSCDGNNRKDFSNGLSIFLNTFAFASGNECSCCVDSLIQNPRRVVNHDGKNDTWPLKTVMYSCKSSRFAGSHAIICEMSAHRVKLGRFFKESFSEGKELGSLIEYSKRDV